jgi:prepilin-type N-terminal cleavage/methylation domain-containing protein
MHKCTNRGFTVIEIMIVVAFIALLAAIAVSCFLRARERSQASLIINDVRKIDSAFAYLVENQPQNR